MFRNPLEKLRYILWKTTEDFSFIENAPEDVILNRAHSLLNSLNTQIDRGGVEVGSMSLFHKELEDTLNDYADDVLLNPSV